MRSVVPAQVRTFAETLMGKRAPITEKNFTEEELQQARDAVKRSRLRSAQAVYHDPTATNGDSGATKYEDYGGLKAKQARKDLDVSKESAMRNTLGRFRYEKTPEGRLVAKDTYDFDDDLVGVAPGIRKTAEYEKMNPLEKVGALISDTRTQGLKTLPSRIGSAFIGRDGRPVEIDLGEADFKKGGKVKAVRGRGDGVAKRGWTKGKMR